MVEAVQQKLDEFLAEAGESSGAAPEDTRAGGRGRDAGRYGRGYGQEGYAMADESVTQVIARLDATVRELADSVRRLDHGLAAAVQNLTQVLSLHRDVLRSEIATVSARLDVSNMAQQQLAREIGGLRELTERKLEEVLRQLRPAAVAATDFVRGAASVSLSSSEQVE